MVFNGLQVASLLHDDVLDHADTRRGISSLNHAMGNKVCACIYCLDLFRHLFMLHLVMGDISAKYRPVYIFVHCCF